MAFQSAFVTTVAQGNFGIIRSKTEVCDHGLHVRTLEGFTLFTSLVVCTIDYRGISQESRDLSYDILHNPTLIAQNKPRNIILRPSTTLHLHPKTIMSGLHPRSTRSHKSNRKLREHRTLSNQPS